MYITRDDVLLGLAKMELVQLTNDDPYGSEPDLAVLDRAIEYACELADGYLMGRYTLPLDPAPSMLRHLCTDIARHWLHRRRINTADFPKPLEAAYSNAIKILEQIRDGKIQLGVLQAHAAHAHGEGGVRRRCGRGGWLRRFRRLHQQALRIEAAVVFDDQLGVRFHHA